MPDVSHALILFAAGLVAGALNVVAGGGSFLTLPILIFTGLPPTVANGTNRVGILFQNAGAVWGFDRHEVLDWDLATRAAVPATVGAVFGTWAALRVGDEEFRRILSLLMVAVTLWTLLVRDPRRRAGSSRTAGGPEEGGQARGQGWAGEQQAKQRRTREQPATQGGRARQEQRMQERADGEQGMSGDGSPPRWLLALAFLGVGFYGGFVQAGVGFFILAVTTFAGLDLVRGNAVKVLCVLAFTALALSIFAFQGMVVWSSGLALAAGTVLGGQVGVRFTTLKGHRWVRAVVTVTVILFAVRLWFA